MAILKGMEMHYVKCNPKRPNNKYNKKNPTWEVQIRVYTKEEKEKLVKLHLKPKAVRENNEEDGKILYWRVNLRKKSIKSDGEKAGPVEVKNGNLDDVDPDTIGNGSIGNIRIFQYDYENDDEKGVATVLMGIQLTKHILYKAKPRDDEFEETETETVAAANEDDDDSDHDDHEDRDDDDDREERRAAPSAPSQKKAVAGF